ncbi:ARM repeat-containing protein [Fomitiporia mediterranea MF3/22]|uniref:ARM repeat-containing protein n=1 Tax=Fomitiporia mediterranea (strain MF3/22) TaxID=694068 RepID=UPI000440984C|nr:ARM repeat-containing protein [Fomitiporia mediterranea MF3/22]EJD00848.1 ARM repeat-containing protein [Fomitiporia mediterranea MF3/22]
MPRENRKRGKKHKKEEAAETTPYPEDAQNQEEIAQHAGPSWIVDRNTAGHENNGQSLSPDAPFGYVDPDVKAYFKTVDNSLREWQEVADTGELDEGDADPNEERRLFLVAALQELSGKEKQLATDPECSNVLERMTYSMDDFVKRVFVDRLAGSLEQLSRHRFASHVVQTLLSVAKGTIYREAKGILPKPPDDNEENMQGHLPLLTEIIVNLSNELLPSTTILIMDPFASHVLRSLFVLLCPTIPSATDASSILRSKKSAKHRAKQGPMKSVFTDSSRDADTFNGKGKGKAVFAYPPEFQVLARRFVKEIREKLSENEIRALAVNKSACPVLVILLEMESAHGTSNEAGSLMDTISASLISSTLQKPERKLEPSDFVATLLREPTSSHLLERLISMSPGAAFDAIWDLYFTGKSARDMDHSGSWKGSSGKLGRLSVHPVANFVVARAIARLNSDQLSSVFEELKSSWSKIIRGAKTGVLKALVDRAASLKSRQEEVTQVVLDAFDLGTEEERLYLVECVLYLVPYGELQDARKQTGSGPNAGDTKSFVLEPTIQGSVLVQSLLQLDAPHNQPTIQSLTRLPAPRLLALAHHAVSSRIFDAFLTTPGIPSSARRQLILAFQGPFPALVDDRVGSRVGERLWAAADPYLKEKIAKGLIPHETALVGSHYGKFFMRGLNLYLLKRNPEEWKTQQAQVSTTAAKRHTEEVKHEQLLPASNIETSAAEKRRERKRKRKTGPGLQDEIDELFTSAFGKRQKQCSTTIAEQDPTETQQMVATPATKNISIDSELNSVLGAIRNAPTELKSGGKKNKKQ